LHNYGLAENHCILQKIRTAPVRESQEVGILSRLGTEPYERSIYCGPVRVSGAQGAAHFLARHSTAMGAGVLMQQERGGEYFVFIRVQLCSALRKWLKRKVSRV